MKKWLRLFTGFLFTSLSSLTFINAQDCSPSCFDACIEETCPLNPCAASVQIKGGITPTIWAERSKDAFVASIGPVFVNNDNQRIPPFGKQFNLPYTFGVEGAYNFTGCFQGFVEYNMIRASGKKDFFSRDGVKYKEVLDHFHAWTLHFGARYYFSKEWLCNYAAPFVGLKIGMIKYSNNNFSIDIARDNVRLVHVPYYFGSYGVSTGIQTGLDVDLCNNISMQFIVEAVFAPGPLSNHNIDLVSAIPNNLRSIEVTNYILGQPRLAISFPITLGLRYTF